MKNLIARSDDIDWRLDLDTLKRMHEPFLERDMIHTLAVNNVIGGSMGWQPDVVDYINNTSNFDIQLHGWEHLHYAMMPKHAIYPHLVASLWHTKKFFPKADPTVFYAGWNEYSGSIEETCEELGLKMGGVGDYIMHYCDWGRRPESEIVYFHFWDKQDVENIPRMLDIYNKEKEEQNG